MTPSTHFHQFYQMWIIRITLLKLQVLKLSELGWKYLRNYWRKRDWKVSKSFPVSATLLQQLFNNKLCI